MLCWEEGPEEGEEAVADGHCFCRNAASPSGISPDGSVPLYAPVGVE